MCFNLKIREITSKCLIMHLDVLGTHTHKKKPAPKAGLGKRIITLRAEANETD